MKKSQWWGLFKKNEKEKWKWGSGKKERETHENVLSTEMGKWQYKWVRELAESPEHAKESREGALGAPVARRRLSASLTRATLSLRSFPSNLAFFGILVVSSLLLPAPLSVFTHFLPISAPVLRVSVKNGRGEGLCAAVLQTSAPHIAFSAASPSPAHFWQISHVSRFLTGSAGFLAGNSIFGGTAKILRTFWHQNSQKSVESSGKRDAFPNFCLNLKISNFQCFFKVSKGFSDF